MSSIRRFLFILFSLSSLALTAQIENTGQLLDAMQVKNRAKWFNTLTFKQETIRYSQQGQQRDTSIWDEAVKYPDQFRIDYLNNNRTIIFKNDSAYRFDNRTYVDTRYQPQEFLLFKGGLYFMSPGQVMDKLKSYGYDVSLFREDEFNGQKVYVVGAKKGDLKTKQFWVNKDYFYTVRRISTVSGGRVLDVQYEGHKAFGGGWVERKVIFYINDQLLQVENYLDIKVDIELDELVFDSKSPSFNWYK